MSVKILSYVFGLENKPPNAALMLTLVALADSCDDDGFTWIGMSTIAEKCGYSASRATKNISKLEELGYVTVYARWIDKDGAYCQTSNIYRVNTPSNASAEPSINIRGTWQKRQPAKASNLTSAGNETPLLAGKGIVDDRGGCRGRQGGGVVDDRGVGVVHDTLIHQYEPSFEKQSSDDDGFDDEGEPLRASGQASAPATETRSSSAHEEAVTAKPSEKHAESVEHSSAVEETENADPKRSGKRGSAKDSPARRAPQHTKAELDAAWEAVKACWRIENAGVIANYRLLLFGMGKGRGDWERMKVNPPMTVREFDEFCAYARRKASELPSNAIPTQPATIARWVDDFRLERAAARAASERAAQYAQGQAYEPFSGKAVDDAAAAEAARRAELERYIQENAEQIAEAKKRLRGY